MPNSADPLTLHTNVLIMDGVYKNLLGHLIVHLSADYPLTGPAVNVAPGLNFGHKYHEYIDDSLSQGSQICIDMLTNMRFMYNGSLHDSCGWTLAYTLSTVLMQPQVFFVDPELDVLCQRKRKSSNYISM